MDENKIIKKLDEHDKKFDSLEKRLDVVVEKLMDHDDRLQRIEETMATKDDMRELKSMIENLTTIVKKIQEDHVFAVEWLKRLQTQIDRQDDDIRRIKLQLHLV